MNLKLNLCIFKLLFCIILTCCDCHDQEAVKNPPEDSLSEKLFIRPLIDGKLLAHFEFKTLYRKDVKSLRWENKLQIFPLSIADLVATTDLNKLHFSLTKGNWDYRNWGYPTRSSPPGAQIRVQFSDHNEDQHRSWNRLVNSLSGKFCASLSSADSKSVVTSKLAFCPTSILQPNSTERMLYSNLPEEVLCTGNLTPWKKLLPCYSNSGLASLLNAVNLLKSSYSSLALDLEPIPSEHSDKIGYTREQLLLTQSMTVVFNPLLLFEGKQSWSLSKIFGNPVQGTCPLASISQIHVDITDLDDLEKLYPKSYTKHNLEMEVANGLTQKRSYAIFDLSDIMSDSNHSSTMFNSGVKQTQIFKRPAMSSRPKIPIFIKTHVAGIGSIEGNIVGTIINDLPEPVRITYMDVVPYFMRIYLHTLIIRTKSGQELKPDKLNYVLSEDSSPTLVEFSIILPARTEVQISYDFDRAFLRWTQYKPDAHKGVLLGPAMIGISPCHALTHLSLPNSKSRVGYNSTMDCSADPEDMLMVYAKPLLIILPTPDFSMPYNVICIVCTVLVAAIGPIYDLTTNKPLKKVSKKIQSESDDGNLKEQPDKKNN